MTHPSDSQPQRDAERYMFAQLSLREGVPIEPATIALEQGVHVVVDGFNEQPQILCEVYAHLGRTRGGQNHKIARDILKLAAIGSLRGGNWRKILCFADAAAMQAVKNNSWLAAVCRALGVESVLVPLSPGLQAQVASAQKRQVMVNQLESGV